MQPEQRTRRSADPSAERQASASRTLLARVRDARLQGWLFVAPALAAYAVFVLWPLVQTFKYSLYQWDGVLPARWVGLDNFKTVFTDHELLGVLGHAFQLIIFFSGIPVAARPRRRNRDATRRLSTGQQRRACGAVPAAGRAAGRRRNRLELGAVLDAASSTRRSRPSASAA